VAFGAGWDGGGAPSCWPWIEALRAIRPEIGEPDERLKRDLGPLWEGASPGDDTPDPELNRFRRLDALRAVLLAASARRPWLLVLDGLGLGPSPAHVRRIVLLRHAARSSVQR